MRMTRIRAARAAGLLALSACDDENGNPTPGAGSRNTPFLWNSTTGTSTSTTGGLYTPLNWIDPNLGPIGPGPGGGGVQTSAGQVP